MAINKVYNEYANVLGPLYDATPKAVFAAIAVSALTVGGDYLDEATERVLAEWRALYEAGVVPQKPRRVQQEAMNDATIRQTIAAARMTDEERTILLSRALTGEREALFVVAALKRRQEKER